MLVIAIGFLALSIGVMRDAAFPVGAATLADFEDVFPVRGRSLKVETGRSDEVSRDAFALLFRSNPPGLLAQRHLR